MENVFLAIMMLAVFVFGFFAISQIGKFMDENYKGRRNNKSRKKNYHFPFNR